MATSMRKLLTHLILENSVVITAREDNYAARLAITVYPKAGPVTGIRVQRPGLRALG